MTSPAPARGLPDVWKLVGLGVVAFAAGAAIVWLLLAHRTQAPETMPPAGETVVPDVSKLPPAQAALVQANWAFDQHRWTEAIGLYERAIQGGYDNADVRTDLGSAYRFANQPDKAIQEYETAQRENPQHENSLFDLATLYLQTLHDPGRAIRLLEDFQRRFPQSGAVPRVQELIDQARQAATQGPKQ